MYIPRNEDQISISSQKQDSWKNWLENLCLDNNISLIDPSNEFSRGIKEGKQIFGDHFTLDGHILFAESFTRWYREIHKSLQKNK